MNNKQMMMNILIFKQKMKKNKAMISYKKLIEK